ncbi:putative diacylglycerol kinase (ATP) [Helianthus anomalus]
MVARVFESSSKDIAACDGEKSPVGEDECPMVVFINSKSGGRNGPNLMVRLHNLMGQEHVFFFFHLLFKKTFMLNLLYE